MLAMISLDQRTAYDLAKDTAARVRAQRKGLRLTQAQMAEKAGMSLGSYKRFEQTGQIAFSSLANIAIALGCEDQVDDLFSRPQYASIEEVINERR